MSFPVVFADTTTTIAWVILLASVLGWVIYGLGNLRSSKREIGAEIKLAANRKPYYDDERLEGEKNRAHSTNRSCVSCRYNDCASALLDS